MISDITLKSRQGEALTPKETRFRLACAWASGARTSDVLCPIARQVYVQLRRHEDGRTMARERLWAEALEVARALVSDCVGGKV